MDGKGLSDNNANMSVCRLKELLLSVSNKPAQRMRQVHLKV